MTDALADFLASLPPAKCGACGSADVSTEVRGPRPDSLSASMAFRRVFHSQCKASNGRHASIEPIEIPDHVRLA